MQLRTTLAITAAFILASASAGFAQTSQPNSASQNAPGQQMQEKGSVKGTTGASGYAPGQQMQEKGSVKGTTGASGYAPGQMKKDSDDSSMSKSKK